MATLREYNKTLVTSVEVNQDSIKKMSLLQIKQLNDAAAKGMDERNQKILNRAFTDLINGKIDRETYYNIFVTRKKWSEGELKEDIPDIVTVATTLTYFTPVFGEFKAMYGVKYGVDPMTGQPLKEWEKSLAAFTIVSALARRKRPISNDEVAEAEDWGSFNKVMKATAIISFKIALNRSHDVPGEYIKENPRESVSTVADFIPILGNVKAGQETVTGVDAISGYELEPWQRWISGAGIIGGGLGKFAGGIIGKGLGKGTVKNPSGFAERAKLEGHFDKHGKEFGGLYKNADEYLVGAKEVINNGIKVKYEYKGEIRTGYVKFMGNNKNGKAKFEFVGTNNNGEITTYHTQSGKKFWKTINGENIPVINPAE
ncbi:pre-toxin TG domain-containing protein [Salipaludibacillus sp. HK11]|uniref:pre-toxin TG domain-containing protein n=1 Tax=Salipaludibacillus sp. HK11 TaxID=3394320 RepID=UPI0039FD993D